jgi:hypothetical protein
VTSLRFGPLSTWAVGATLLMGACAGRSTRSLGDEPSAGSGGSGARVGGSGGAGPGAGTGGVTGGGPHLDGGSGPRPLGGAAGAAGAGLGPGDDGGSGPSPRGGSAGRDGGGSAGRGGSAGGGGAGGSGTAFPCESYEAGSSVDQCRGGEFWHRPEAPTCTEPPERRLRGSAGGGGEAGTSGECELDSDCDDAPLGYCVSIFITPTQYGHHCEYACRTDTDCKNGEACLCQTRFSLEDNGPALPLAICAESGCTLDEQCEPGFLCIAGLPYWCDARPDQGFHCQTPEDTCGPGAPGQCDFGDCVFSYGTKTFTCMEQSASL